MRRALLVAWDLWDIDPYWRNCLIVSMTGIIVLIFSGAPAPQNSGANRQMGSYSGSYSPSSTIQGNNSQTVVAPTPQVPLKIAPSVTIGTVTTKGAIKSNNTGFATVVNAEDDDSDQSSTFAEPSFKIKD